MEYFSSKVFVDILLFTMDMVDERQSNLSPNTFMRFSFSLVSSLNLTVLGQNICKELKKTSDVSEAIKVAYFETDEEIGRQKINYSGIFHSFVLSFKFERFSQELQVFLV